MACRSPSSAEAESFCGEGVGADCVCAPAAAAGRLGEADNDSNASDSEAGSTGSDTDSSDSGSDLDSQSESESDSGSESDSDSSSDSDLSSGDDSEAIPPAPALPPARDSPGQLDEDEPRAGAFEGDYSIASPPGSGSDSGSDSDDVPLPSWEAEVELDSCGLPPPPPPPLPPPWNDAAAPEPARSPKPLPPLPASHVSPSAPWSDEEDEEEDVSHEAKEGGPGDGAPLAPSLAPRPPNPGSAPQLPTKSPRRPRVTPVLPVSGPPQPQSALPQHSGAASAPTAATPQPLHAAALGSSSPEVSAESKPHLRRSKSISTSILQQNVIPGSLLEGFLEKMGAIPRRGGWKARFFALMPAPAGSSARHTLLYFKGIPSDTAPGKLKPLGEIPIHEHCSLQASPGGLHAKPFVLVITPEEGRRRFYLACTSEYDREHWLRVLSNTRGRVRKDAPKVLPGSEKEGFLLKQGGLNQDKGWKQRFFAMNSEPLISYYKSSEAAIKSAGKPLGRIPLAATTRLTRVHEPPPLPAGVSQPKPFAFSVSCSSGEACNFLLCADSEASRDRWLIALQLRILQLQGRPAPEHADPHVVNKLVLALVGDCQLPSRPGSPRANSPKASAAGPASSQLAAAASSPYMDGGSALAAAAAAPDTSLLFPRTSAKEGWLLKMGRPEKPGGWRMRFVIVNSFRKELEYFASVEKAAKGKRLGLIKLGPGTAVVEEALPTLDKPFVFSVGVPGRKYLFAAPAIEDCRVWMGTLRSTLP